MHQWFTKRALLLHLTVVVVVPTFLGLGWWQYHAALGGNELSWAYTFEWPFFAGYAVFVWWKMLHDQPGQIAAKVRSARFAATPVGWAMSKRATPFVEDDDAAGADHVDPSSTTVDHEELIAQFRTALDTDGAALLQARSPTVSTAAGSPAAAVDATTAAGSAASGTVESGTRTGLPRTPEMASPTDEHIGDEPADPHEEEDPELAEYNRYLAALAASGRRKHW